MQRATALVLISLVILIFYAMGFDQGNKLGTQNSLYVTPLNHFFFFAAGYMLGIAYKTKKDYFYRVRMRINYFVIALLLFVVIGIVGNNAGQIELFDPVRRITISVFLVIMVWSFMCIDVSGRIVEFLGEISYGVYLIHPVIVFNYLPRMHIDSAWINFSIVFIGSIFLAYMSHRFFEMPAQRFIRRIARA